MGYGLHVIQNPTGSYSFVGSVPQHLAYRMADGSPMPPDIARGVQQCGPGLFRRRGVVTVTFPTAEQAVEEARSLGFEPDGYPGQETRGVVMTWEQILGALGRGRVVHARPLHHLSDVLPEAPMRLSKTMRDCVVAHTRDLIDEHTDVNGEPPSQEWIAHHIALFVAGDEETGQLPADHDREKVGEAKRLCAETAELDKAGRLFVPRTPNRQQDAIEKRLRERKAELERQIAAEAAEPTSPLAIFGLRAEARDLSYRLGAIEAWKQGL